MCFKFVHVCNIKCIFATAVSMLFKCVYVCRRVGAVISVYLRERVSEKECVFVADFFKYYPKAIAVSPREEKCHHRC